MSLIHFGCWGNYDNIFNLINILKDIASLSPPDILTVSGDNYYPKKENKQKKLNVDHFNELQTLLNDYTINIPNRFILLGNHEFDSYVNAEKNVKIDLHRTFYSNSKINLIENCSQHIIDDHTLVIMINTSIYEKHDDPCYKMKKILQEDSQGNIGRDEITNQLDIVLNILATNQGN